MYKKITDYPYMKIKGYGPIKKAEISLKKHNIIIGEQATGKSIIAKLFYTFSKIPVYLKNEIIDLTNHLIGLYNNPNYSKYDFSDHCSTFIMGIVGKYLSEAKENRYFEHNGYIQYNYNSKYHITVYRESFSVDFSLFGKAAYSSMSNIPKDILDKNRTLSRTILEKLIDSEFSINNDRVFFPAGRMTYIKDLKISETKNAIDLDFVDFISRIEELVSRDARTYFGSDYPPGVLKETYSILKGEFRRTIRNYLEISDNKGNPLNLDLSEISSGQKETLWILNGLRYYLLNKDEACFMTIEEPEAHIYPNAQYSIVKCIADFVNHHENNQVLITTHSPYILGAYNNLIYASIIGSKNNNSKLNHVNDIIPLNYWIQKNDIAAYKLIDGVLTDIMDFETGLINNYEIDEASRVMSYDFDRIFDYDND